MQLHHTTTVVVIFQKHKKEETTELFWMSNHSVLYYFLGATPKDAKWLFALLVGRRCKRPDFTWQWPMTLFLFWFAMLTWCLSCLMSRNTLEKLSNKFMESLGAPRAASVVFHYHTRNKMSNYRAHFCAFGSLSRRHHVVWSLHNISIAMTTNPRSHLPACHATEAEQTP